MDGFFVTINCSKIFDSNETSYKIFIDKSKMSIVYELIEWIRFMFGLEKCFFLIHENSVIHELEDIRVLEILSSLEIRPCLLSNCIHKKMETKFFSKLNFFTYWNKMKVHKLFQARCNYIIQKVFQNSQNHLNITEKSSIFSLQPCQNLFEEIDKSKLANNQHEKISSSNLNNNVEDGESQVNQIMKDNILNEHQLDLEKVNSLISDKNINFDEMKSPKNFFTQVESSAHMNSTDLNLFTKSSALSSSVNKKQKIQSQSKKNSKKVGIPFSLGALLADIRQKAQIQEFKENQEMGLEGKLSNSVCLVEENVEDENLHTKSTYTSYNESLLKKKRKRKHKKQNFQKDLNCPQINLSWDYYEPTSNAKPNHIRFNDSDEIMETETTENSPKPFDNSSGDSNSLKVLNSATQQMIDLITEQKSLIEKNESNKNCLMEAQEEVCEKLIDQNNEGLNCTSQTESYNEKKEPEDSQQNLPDLESLKQKIKHPTICTRFY